MINALNVQTSEDAKERILSRMNDQQKAIVQDYQGFSMVSAGPGAGKTRVIVQRTAFMIEDGVPASSILLFSFTKKAANELKERVLDTIGDKAFGITVSTYHSFCARILRRFCNLVQYKENFTIIDGDVQKKFVTEIIKNLEFDLQAKEILAFISKCKEHHWTPQQAANRCGDKEEAKEPLVVYERYQEELRKNNVMDFDDLIFHMVTILEKSELVRHKIYNRYRYITADECQDSSVIDTKLIFLLTNPKTMNLCLVGDSDQGIYSFRGANFEHFYKVVNKFEHKNYRLERNYRSTPEIVDAAQSLIKYNVRPDEKTVFSKNEHGEKIAVMACRSQANEADRVAETIMKLIKSGQMKFGDAAVLYRNTFISRAFEDSFRRFHIPYELVGGISFYKRMEVQDILAYLTFFENPLNTDALERIINIPKSRIGKKSFEKIKEAFLNEAGKYAILDAREAVKIIKNIAKMDSLKRISTKILAFVQRASHLAEYVQTAQDAASIVDKVVKDFGYYDYLRDYDEDTCNERIMNVQELQRMAEGYGTVQEFLEDIMTINPNVDGDEEDGEKKDKVRLMTMHASKGLEFPLVFIVSANEGIVPSWRCESIKDVQEERRLFYVAMTRAKENLVISYTNTVLQKGRVVHSKPSQFIDQISPDFVAR